MEDARMSDTNMKKVHGGWTVYLRNGFTGPSIGTAINVDISGEPTNHHELADRVARLLSWESRIKDALVGARTALRNSGDGSDEVLDAEDAIVEALKGIAGQA